MSHYDVNAGVPKTLIQYLIRWAVAHRPVRRGDRRGARGDPRAPRSRPSWCRPTRTAAMQSTEAKIGPYELHDFFLYHIMRYGQRAVEGRLPRLARLARRGAAALWPIDFPEAARHAYDLADDPQVARESSSLRFFALQPVQALGASRTAPRSPPAARSRPRGDWRAPSRRHRRAVARRAAAERAGTAEGRRPDAAALEARGVWLPAAIPPRPPARWRRRRPGRSAPRRSSPLPAGSRRGAWPHRPSRAPPPSA